MNAADRWARVSSILSRALDQPEAERTAFVAEAIRQQPELRTEVLALLDEVRGTGGFLDQPPADASDLELGDGGTFGPYRVLGKLGEGGMGIVHLAERSDGQFTRKVAIKRVASTAPGSEALRRFGDERQILARLDHPNIARLLDAGVDAAGIPYLVMDHVEGVPLTAFCAERRLGVRERLALFGRICTAVQHAHQSLVIHRDIKPANILVTADGEPKLLDFGIARLFGDARDGKATETVHRALTLDYASPEQVRGGAVTTASDVYSLGVVLYELLAGRRPYEVGTRGLAEAVELVCERVPPPPSQVAPAERRAEIAGDLDSIVRKATEKSPSDRYASVAELAGDVAAHLDHLPVKARRPSFGYVARRFVRRHRTAAALAGAMLAVLVAGMAAVLWQARVAERERARAQRRFEQVRHLANSVVFELHDAIRFLPGATEARHLLVTRGLEYLDSLAGEAHDDAGLGRELAAAYRRLGDAQGDPVGASLGDTEGALGTYRKALAVQQSVFTASGGDPRDRFAIAELQFQIAAVHRARGDLREAERAYHATAGQVEIVLSTGPARPEYRGAVTAAYQRLAEVLGAQGRMAEANQALQNAIAQGEIHSREWPDNWKVRLNLSVAYSADAHRLAQEGRHVEALSRARSARAIQEGLLAAQPLQSQVTRALLFSLNSEGQNLEALGRTGEAVQTYERALEVARAVSERDPKDKFGRLALAVAAESLGTGLVAAGRVRQGMERLEEARRAAAGVVREDPGSAYARERLVSVEEEIRGARESRRAGRGR